MGAIIVITEFYSEFSASLGQGTLRIFFGEHTITLCRKKGYYVSGYNLLKGRSKSTELFSISRKI
ncbi:hypothetical protein [Pedobacter alluvionis]|uniref:Uncharacterized protein n=1 Tax=Pedobacter alluvionis TaxID=475253 RepID=A0ABY2HI41_9SPHI|nr:hypothetical protein [Pedobacter alluvionis]TFB28362.1 hypothetical protein E3V97_23045 [Pedobacter alluvionis]